MSRIPARNWWTKTSLELTKGKHYRFTATGSWKDAKYTCSATGYSEAKLDRWSWLKRDPNALWFSLIGQIDQKRWTQFDIGHLLENNLTYTAVESGTLYCFANDVWFMYFNNSGSVELSVTEVEH